MTDKEPIDRHQIDLDPEEWEGGAKDEARERLFREKGEFIPGPLVLGTKTLFRWTRVRLPHCEEEN